MPSCKLYIKDGLLHLETTLIVDTASLKYVDKSMAYVAIKRVTEQMNLKILP